LLIISDWSYVNRAIPENQQIVIAKNETAYTWFYISIGFAALVLLLFFLGWFWNKCKSKQLEEEAHKRLPPFADPESTGSARESSVFDSHSMMVARVQPKSAENTGYDRVEYPPSPHRYPPSTGRGMTFGLYKQQPPNVYQNEALMRTLEKQAFFQQENNGSNGNVNGSEGGRDLLGKKNSLIYVPGRHDSLDAYYVMDPQEKSPFQQQMDDATEFRTYLHLTSEFSRCDSITEGESSEPSTLPVSNRHSENPSIENVHRKS